MPRLTPLPFLSSTLPFAMLAAAQNALPDYDSSPAAANATGVYELPGVSLNGNGLSLSNDSSQAWRLTQTVTRRPSDLVTLGSSYLTAPSLNSSLEFAACARWFSIPDDIASASQADDGSCSSILGLDCVRDLKDQYLRQATALANQKHAANTVCGEIFASVVGQQYPASCQNFTESLVHGSQGSLTISIGTYPSNGTSLSPFLIEFFDTHSHDVLGLSAAKAAAPKEASNYAVYDAAVRSITPFIIVRLGNATATNQDAFADVQMVCARAKDVKAGSRVPEMTSAGTVARVGAGWIMGLVALMVVIAV